ncbi:MAG TPA: hypothetical protein VEV61_18965 [Streptosporangiaceae bacterium]|nr:hypothetical protein [Streptosporangiaceae bacterium]
MSIAELESTWHTAEAQWLPGPAWDAGPAWDPGPRWSSGLPSATSFERAVIGDELRKPMVWCELGGCVAWHADPAALGERDVRIRALAAGWRHDVFGRLICPKCLQRQAFWNARPVVAWIPAVPPAAEWPVPADLAPVPEHSVADSGDDTDSHDYTDSPHDRDEPADHDDERVDAAITRAWRSHPGRHRKDFFTDS